MKSTVVKSCKICNTAMLWEHPYLEGHTLESSCNIDDSDICYECITEHCTFTNCLGCSIGDYPNCKYQNIKEFNKNYKEK